MSVKTVIGAVTVLLGLTALAEPGLSVPRYAARYGQRCTLCHVDPSGGGQRTLYAVQYIVPMELSLQRLTAEEIAGIDPVLGKNLTVGLDLRTIYHASDPPRPGIDNFLQMQSAFYLSFDFARRFSAHVNRSQSGTLDVFGLAHVLPLDGHLRVGRFTPAYGWRFADHTVYTRELLGWFAQGRTDVGLEAAVNPGRFTFSAALTNGSRGAAADADERLAVTGQGIVRANWRELGAGLGGSIWSNHSATGERFDRGPFGYLTFGPATWLGEAAWSTNDPPGPGSERTSWVASQELSWRVLQGFDLRATYDFFDPDLDRESGTRDRIAAGLDLLPYPFLNLQTMVRRERYEGAPRGAPSAPEAVGDDTTWFELQVHLLY